MKTLSRQRICHLKDEILFSQHLATFISSATQPSRIAINFNVRHSPTASWTHFSRVWAPENGNKRIHRRYSRSGSVPHRVQYKLWKRQQSDTRVQKTLFSSAHRNLCGHPYFAASGWKILLGPVYFSLASRQRTKRSLWHTHIGGEADWLMRVSHSRTKSLCCAYQNRALFIPARPSHTHSLAYKEQTKRAQPSRRSQTRINHLISSLLLHESSHGSQPPAMLHHSYF